MKDRGRMIVSWHDRGREPQHPPNPAYPHGVHLDLSDGASAACTTPLPYPAKRCGFFLVICESCGTRMVVTTAGRVDDPRSIKMACKLN